MNFCGAEVSFVAVGAAAVAEFKEMRQPDI